MNPRHLARFPFLSQTTEFIKRRGIELPDLLTGVAYEEARLRGRERVINALERGETGERPVATEVQQIQEMLSYAVARMLVSCVADGFLIRRYALAEGVTMNRRLQGEKAETILEIANQLGVKGALVGGSLRIHFADYLKFTSRIRSKEWKLVNTELRDGFVLLPTPRFCRVLQQALQDRLEMELPLPVTDDILDALSEETAEIKAVVATLRERFKAEDFGRASIVRFPPCMKRLVAIAQSGENMPHTARFALTSFLHFIGLSQEEILNLFSASPDFDPAKTRYQIEHITGEISGTEYSPPECRTMRSYGICISPDDLCKGGRVSHPLSYYRLKGRRKRERTDTRDDTEDSQKS